MALFFGVQSIVGFLYLETSFATEVTQILFLGALSYLIAYRALRVKDFRNAPFINKLIMSDSALKIMILSTSCLYFLVFAFAVISAEKVALFEVFKGATALEIVESREMFLRAREGSYKLLIYAFSILSSAVMPYFLMLGFIRHIKIVYPLFFLFLISLTFSMEKALFLKALFPLLLISVNGYFYKKAILWLPALAIVILVGMTYLARGSDNGASVGTTNVPLKMLSEDELNRKTDIFQGGKYLSFREHVIKYFPLRGDSGIGYLINRAVWIPYITAYDWIKYFEQEMGGQHLWGKTSIVISKFMHVEQFPMEGKIFDYQFGLRNIKTAAANTNFMIDGYINFSWFGVICISAFMGCVLAYLRIISNPAASACIYFFLFQLLGGGFLGTLLGGGLFIFLGLVLFIHPAPKVIIEEVKIG